MATYIGTLCFLEKMGFGRKWVNWIKWCNSTVTFSILANDTPAGLFRSSRGLRQGTPLSPYIFVIGMEALSRLIVRAVEGWGGEGLAISHSLYADGILFFFF